MSTGTVLNVLDRKTSGWVHVRTTGGAEGYVSAEYVAVYDPSSSSASVSVSSVDLAQYKTIYIQASSSGSVTWESSDASVATAKAGVSGQLFIYGAAPGTAKITAKAQRHSLPPFPSPVLVACVHTLNTLQPVHLSI